MRARWPWITIAVALVAACNPIGLDILHAAFLSNEALSRGIWQPLVTAAVIVLIVAGMIEWAIRRAIARRSPPGP